MDILTVIGMICSFMDLVAAFNIVYLEVEL